MPQPSRPAAVRPGRAGQIPPRQSNAHAKTAPTGKGAAAAAPANGKNDRSPEPDSLPLLDANNFQPDAAALKKATTKGAAAAEKLDHRTREQAIQAVHALRLLAPAIISAMAGGGTEAQQAERFAQWVVQAQKAANEWADAWAVAPEDRPWVQAGVERVFGEHPILAQRLTADRWAPAISVQVPPPSPSWMPLGAAAPLALLQALAPVQRVQMAFGLGRPDPEEDLLSSARLLAEAAQDTVLELLDPTASSDIRTTVFAAAAVEAGKTLAQLWIQHGTAEHAAAQQRSASEQAAWERAHPNGSELEHVFQAFREHSARLRRLARLARPRA